MRQKKFHSLRFTHFSVARSQSYETREQAKPEEKKSKLKITFLCAVNAVRRIPLRAENSFIPFADFSITSNAIKYTHTDTN